MTPIEERLKESLPSEIFDLLMEKKEKHGFVIQTHNIIEYEGANAFVYKDKYTFILSVAPAFLRLTKLTKPFTWKYKVAEVIVHELTHVEQMITGDLTLGERGTAHWKGQVVSMKTTTYGEYKALPWEIEAFTANEAFAKKIRGVNNEN